jgi:hypothetical protein
LTQRRWLELSRQSAASNKNAGPAQVRSSQGHQLFEVN